MPARETLSGSQRARLTEIPDMDARELARRHTLSEADIAEVVARHGAANRLGFAVRLRLLRYPGRPLKQGEVAPRSVVEFVASQVGADPDAFAEYGGGPEGAGRDTTRREHVAEIVRAFGFRPFDTPAYREPSRWLLPPLGWERIALAGVYRWNLRGTPQGGLRPPRSQPTGLLRAFTRNSWLQFATVCSIP